VLWLICLYSLIMYILTLNKDEDSLKLDTNILLTNSNSLVLNLLITTLSELNSALITPLRNLSGISNLVITSQETLPSFAILTVMIGLLHFNTLLTMLSVVQSLSAILQLSLFQLLTLPQKLISHQFSMTTGTLSTL